MLKQVSLVLAFVALAAAAPQFPLYHHPFPLYNPYMTVPLMRSPLSPYQPHYMPYPVISPYSYSSHVPSPVQPPQPAPVTSTRIGSEVAKPIEPSNDEYFDDKNISLQLAEKLLTPQQLRLLEETVAAMNPLEYAARLEATKDPEEAIRLFKKSRY